MKKVLFLKILKYIGVACLGAFIGMGVLVGASCCSSSKEGPSKVLDKSSRVIKRSHGDYLTDDDAYFNLKSLSQLQALHMSDMSDTGINPWTDSNGLKVYNVNVSYYWTGGNTIDRYRLTMSFYNNGLLKALASVPLSNSSSSWQYFVDTNNSQLQILTSYAIVVPNFSSIRTGYQNAINKVFGRVNTGVVQSYTFASDFNYNAPFNGDASNTFIENPTSGDSSSFYLYNIDTPYFFSGGFIYNRISLQYWKGRGTAYKDNVTGDIKTNTNDLFYFGFMMYQNTNNSQSVVVCERLQYQYTTSNSGTSYYIGNGVRWINADYQHLGFFQTINDIKTINLLTQFNNQLVNYDNSSSNAVGLGNVFSLLSQAFTAWLPILSVQLIPGITLGLLLFMPLVVGIIVLVIWIVKR